MKSLIVCVLFFSANAFSCPTGFREEAVCVSASGGHCVVFQNYCQPTSAAACPGQNFVNGTCVPKTEAQKLAEPLQCAKAVCAAHGKVWPCGMTDAWAFGVCQTN